MEALPQVFVNEGTFGIIDDGDVPIETVDWSRGMIAPMANGALVLTGINTGNVQVRVASDRTQQSSPDNQVWEENVSAHVWAPKGNLRIESLVHGPHPDLPPLSTAGPGWYEVEVKARGRQANPDGSVLQSSESYLIVVRPDASSLPPGKSVTPMPVDAEAELRRQQLLRGV
ncbi:hypothetical protein HET69_05325 [Streptomyces sp. CJ_13]|uniref:hypothetical protein n=1 Tax=Streptomyces sp. CJ_13 TaxID=2724943 RepID=UPI001BDD1326|nr:hypothetical protein [Streptomyces sp. CJ_13]MBT1183440.1 hypothetical protein [Streptomyces sp. CJ_13]